MKKAVIAVAPTRREAELVTSMLYSAGFDTKDISAVIPHDEENAKAAAEGMIAGAAAGGTVGGALGLIVGFSVLAIPGLGLLLAAGPLLGVLGGMAAGATTGGMVGALVGLGIPEIEANGYVTRLRQGQILIAVHTDTHEQRVRARDVFVRAGIPDTTTHVEEHALAR